MYIEGGGALGFSFQLDSPPPSPQKLVKRIIINSSLNFGDYVMKKKKNYRYLLILSYKNALLKTLQLHMHEQLPTVHDYFI